MEIVKLNAQPRYVSGKGPARQLRRSGRIPGVLYGPNIDTMPISINIQELERMFNNPGFSRGLINLVVEGSTDTKKTVMIKEFQRDPVRHDYLHIDFFEINMDVKISTMVSVVTTGEAKGVEEGGILQIIRRELECYCLPKDIPEQIEIDVTNMEIGDSIHVSEMVLPDGVEVPYDVDFTVVTLVSPKMEAPAEEEVAEEEALAEGEAVEGEEGESAAATEE